MYTYTKLKKEFSSSLQYFESPSDFSFPFPYTLEFLKLFQKMVFSAKVQDFLFIVFIMVKKRRCTHSFKNIFSSISLI